MSSEIEQTVANLANDLEFIETAAFIPKQWATQRWHRFTAIAADATVVSRKTAAIAKLAYYAIYAGKLWGQAYDTLEDWIGDVSVDHVAGMSRSSLFEMFADVEMCRKEHLTYQDIAELLAGAPTALRDARRLWYDADGKVKEDINLPAGGVKMALQTAAGLSSSQARTYVAGDVAGKTARFVKDWVSRDDGVVLAVLHVEGKDIAYNKDLVIKGLDSHEDAELVMRKLGWRYDRQQVG